MRPALKIILSQHILLWNGLQFVRNQHGYSGDCSSGCIDPSILSGRLVSKRDKKNPAIVYSQWSPRESDSSEWHGRYDRHSRISGKYGRLGERLTAGQRSGFPGRRGV
jgi:hypothetical protein